MEHLDKPLAGALVTRYPRSVAKGSEGYVPNWGRPENSETGAAEGSLIEHLRILRRHKGPIFLVSLTGLILGIAVSVAMKPVYRARASLEVLNINQDFMNMKQANPVSTEDNSYDTSEEQTQAKLLEGVALQRRVLSKLDPARPGTVENPQMATAGWRSWFQLSQPVPVTERERLLGKLTASLKVRPVARTRVLEVSAESTDPRLAAQFVNTLLEEFIQQNVEARLNSGERTGDWLHHEINEARSNLQRAEDALQDYARKSGLIFTDDTTNVETEKLQQLQQQLSSATADRIAKQSHFELAKNSPPDALGDILNDNVVRDTSAKMLDLRRQVASLGAVFNPGYSKLEQAQAELATIEASFQRERTDILRRIENDYVESADKEKMLAAAYDGQVRDVTGQGEKLIQYNILKREADSSRQLYDTMLQQTKQASIATAMRASSVRVVDPAEVPSRPFSPSFRMNAAIGLFCGCFLSVVLFTMRERADRTLQQPGHIKLWTEMTELGTIPAASFVKLGYGSADNTPDDQTAAVGRRALRFRGEPSEVELMTSRRGSSILAEAFRCTLTSILFVGENGSRPRVLVFTSASPGDGKTTTVSNLALASAEIRRKVLVIDADLRRPRMHNIFDVDNQVGLSNILKEELSSATVAGLIKETRFPGLHVLPAGPPTQAAAHLMYSPNLGALITQVRSEYDMILIDAPPILQMTDARVAGRLADAMVLVARAGKTTRDALIAARDRLAEDGTVVLGTVLNGWDPKKTVGGYYGYGYGYNPYKKYLKKGSK